MGYRGELARITGSETGISQRSTQLPDVSDNEEIVDIRVQSPYGDYTWDRLFSEYYPQMVRGAKRVYPYDPEAGAQEGMLNLFKRSSNYIPQPTGLESYILRVARNAAVDEARKNRKHTLPCLSEEQINSIPDKNFDVDELVIKREQYTALHTALMSLSGVQREIIDVLCFQGLTQLEAAKVLGIPVGTVKTRWKYAIEKLQKILVTSEE